MITTYPIYSMPAFQQAEQKILQVLVRVLEGKLHMVTGRSA